jgi:putative endonuclease
MASQNRHTIYVGVTNSLSRRIEEHRVGLVPGFTKTYHCHVLIYYEEYASISEAIAREKQLKRWRRSKKEWLIRRVNPQLIDLSKIW